MNWLFETTGGRKMFLGLIGIVGVVVLCALGKIDSTLAVDTLKWVIGLVAGAIAIDDVGKSFAAGKTAPVVPPVEVPPVTKVPA